MFRSKPYLENATDVQVILDTPIELPRNNQFQTKRGYKFTLKDRNNFYDWYNAYFRANCVVPENIHTPPPRKVTGNSKGEGGSKAEISEGSGGFIGSSFSRG